MADVGVPRNSITTVRNRIRAVLEREARTRRNRHVIVLGLDGIQYELALRSWRAAVTAKLRSVFPTTSSSAWLSSLSGIDVDVHGVPGVVFKVPEHGGDPINVFEYADTIMGAEIENIFSDAKRFGYAALSIPGDLTDYDCSWRDLLLRHSQRIDAGRFYARNDEGDAAPDSAALCRTLRSGVSDCLQRYGHASPCLIWCLIHVDRHIHRYGYDEHVGRFLASVETTALELTRMNAVVIAHSDHGLTPTTHEPAIERLIERLTNAYGCRLGGAGRTRWIYSQPGTKGVLFRELARGLPTSVRICDADDVFRPGSLSRSRVGEIVLIAQAEAFLAPGGFRFEHGSLTDAEVYVPYSEWHP